LRRDPPGKAGVGERGYLGNSMKKGNPSARRAKGGGYWEKLSVYGPPSRKAGGALLRFLDLELTERCNHNCIHCCINLPGDDAAAKGRELSTGQVQEILQEAVLLGCLTVRFTGGEPLLREDFEELYLFARRLGLRVSIFTNGTLLSPGRVRLLARVPPLERLEVTVYGMEKKSCETVTRTPGSFAAARAGLRRLIEHQVPFYVRGTVLPPTRKEMEALAKWAESLPSMDGPPDSCMFLDLRCRRDSAKNRQIRRLRLPPEEGLRILTRKKEDYLRAMTLYCSQKIGPCGDLLFSCGAGVGRGCVDAYGTFQPCVMLRHPDTVYNLRTGSLGDALATFFPRMRERRASNPGYLQRCARCFLKGLCEQCPAKSWGEHGTLDTPVEYFCEIGHIQARYLGLLKEQESGWEVKDWRERIHRLASRQPASARRGLKTNRYV
jgi:radical SAM protein with 4Fe4S-binding SPASM domain